VGTSGSGKTTLASRIAQQLGIAHVELDSLYWGPGWTPVPRPLFLERVAEALSGEAWTTDGNYSAVRDIVWMRADTILWLDYALPVVMWRVIWRTIRRSALREELWNGNRERIGTALLSRDSIVLWAFNSYQRRKKEYPMLFGQPEYAHLQIVHLSAPRAAEEWLGSLPAAPEG